MAHPAITAIGNVVADPQFEVRQRKDGSGAFGYTQFRIATNTRFRDDNGQWKDASVSFHLVRVYGDQAENVAKSLSKGMRVVVTGQLRTNEYEANGQRQWITYIVADEIAVSLRWAVVPETVKSTRATNNPPAAAATPNTEQLMSMLTQLLQAGQQSGQKTISPEAQEQLILPAPDDVPF